MEKIIAVILMLGLILMVIFWIPTILQIRKTAKSLEDFLKTTQETLHPLLLELKEGINRMNRTTEGIEESIKNVQRLTKSVGEIGAMIDGVNSLIRQTGVAFTVKAASTAVGIKTALSVLAKGLIRKGGGGNE